MSVCAWAGGCPTSCEIDRPESGHSCAASRRFASRSSLGNGVTRPSLRVYQLWPRRRTSSATANAPYPIKRITITSRLVARRGHAADELDRGQRQQHRLPQTVSCVLRLLRPHVEARMAEMLAHRELRNRSAEVLRNVQNGAAYQITNHGKVVALLLPASRGEQAGLRIRKATRRGGFRAVPRVRVDHAVQPTLDELRSDR